MPTDLDLSWFMIIPLPAFDPYVTKFPPGVPGTAVFLDKLP